MGSCTAPSADWTVRYRGHSEVGAPELDPHVPLRRERALHSRLKGPSSFDLKCLGSIFTAQPRRSFSAGPRIRPAGRKGPQASASFSTSGRRNVRKNLKAMILEVDESMFLIVQHFIFCVRLQTNFNRCNEMNFILLNRR